MGNTFFPRVCSDVAARNSPLSMLFISIPYKTCQSLVTCHFNRVCHDPLLKHQQSASVFDPTDEYDRVSTPAGKAGKAGISFFSTLIIFY